jgi:hypothetical protein
MNERHGFLFGFSREKLIQNHGGDLLLKESKVPETVKSLGEFAFCGCLTAVYLAASVEVISAHCFAGCELLADLDITSDSKLAVIEEEAFWDCLRIGFYIPRSLERMDGSAFPPCQPLLPLTLRIDPQNRHFRFRPPFLLDFAGVSIVRYLGVSHEVAIPKHVQRLGPRSFRSAFGLERVILSNAEVSSIGEAAFCCTALKSISIPSSVVSIGSRCFASCKALKTIAFGADSKLSDVGKDVFDRSRRVERILIPEVILPVCKQSFREELKKGLIAIKDPHARDC